VRICNRSFFVIRRTDAVDCGELKKAIGRTLVGGGFQPQGATAAGRWTDIEKFSGSPLKPKTCFFIFQVATARWFLGA
jgi:hypothetical protein